MKTLSQVREWKGRAPTESQAATTERVSDLYALKSALETCANVSVDGDRYIRDPVATDRALNRVNEWFKSRTSPYLDKATLQATKLWLKPRRTVDWRYMIPEDDPGAPTHLIPCIFEHAAEGLIGERLLPTNTDIDFPLNVSGTEYEVQEPDELEDFRLRSEWSNLDMAADAINDYREYLETVVEQLPGAKATHEDRVRLCDHLTDTVQYATDLTTAYTKATDHALDDIEKSHRHAWSAEHDQLFKALKYKIKHHLWLDAASMTSSAGKIHELHREIKGQPLREVEPDQEEHDHEADAMKLREASEGFRQEYITWANSLENSGANLSLSIGDLQELEGKGQEEPGADLSTRDGSSASITSPLPAVKSELEDSAVEEDEMTRLAALTKAWNIKISQKEQSDSQQDEAFWRSQASARQKSKQEEAAARRRSSRVVRHTRRQRKKAIENERNARDADIENIRWQRIEQEKAQTYAEWFAERQEPSGTSVGPVKFTNVLGLPSISIDSPGARLSVEPLTTPGDVDSESSKMQSCAIPQIQSATRAA